MAKIICPPHFNGMRAGVRFVRGVGETKNKHLIEWFKSHGYEVDETPTVVEMEAINSKRGKKAIDKVMQGK